MKIKTTAFTLLFFTVSCLQILSAQPDCSPPGAASGLDANNVSTSIRNGGDLWWNGSSVNPSDGIDWSMCSENIIADSRMLLGVGSFRMLPGQVKTMSFAVVYEANVAHPCPDLSVLQDVGNEVCDFFNENISTSYATPLYKESNLTLSPNPMISQAQLIFSKGNEQLEQVQIYSINGQLMRTYSNLLTNSLSIEKENLTTGMYIYKASTNEGQTYSGKFVVN